MPASHDDEATVDAVVTEADTAACLGSGDVPVLGTPRLLALFEQATVAVVGTRFGADHTTVGTGVELAHLRPTPVGGSVSVRARLTEQDGRALRFSVVAHDGMGRLIGRGEVRRAVVDRVSFLSRL